MVLVGGTLWLAALYQARNADLPLCKALADDVWTEEHEADSDRRSMSLLEQQLGMMQRLHGGEPKPPPPPPTAAEKAASDAEMRSKMVPPKKE